MRREEVGERHRIETKEEEERGEREWERGEKSECPQKRTTTKERERGEGRGRRGRKGRVWRK